MRLAVLLLTSVLVACATPANPPAVPGGALLVADRRSETAYKDDQIIETRLSNRLLARFGRDAHVNVTSWNRQVLLTGEIANAQQQAQLRELARQTEGVRQVFDETVIGPPSPLPARSQDAWISSQVRARLLADRDFAASHVKVVTEGSVIYLLGLVRQSEADAAIAIASRVPRVLKVVTLFEYVE